MVHSDFSGTHYQAGLQWGASLAAHGNFILEHIPFPLTQERIAFAEACLPVYQRYFPTVLAEIRGIAEGQRCEERLLHAAVFSMYAMPPAVGCSCFAVSNTTNILFGRNSDFLTALEADNRHVQYRLTDSGYHFSGNTTSFVQIEDGINEHGLAVGLTAVQPRAIRPGLNAGMLVRLLLAFCRTVSQAIALLGNLPIASAQTLTLADSTGDIAVAECSVEQLAVCRPAEGQPYVCATNAFHTDAMRAMNVPEIDNWDAEPRYRTMDHCLRQKSAHMTRTDAMELLAGKHGFLCQYDRRTGRDTVWSVVYDLKNHVAYRAEGNPARVPFREDRKFRF